MIEVYSPSYLFYGTGILEPKGGLKDHQGVLRIYTLSRGGLGYFKEKTQRRIIMLRNEIFYLEIIELAKSKKFLLFKKATYPPKAISRYQEELKIIFILFYRSEES